MRDEKNHLRRWVIFCLLSGPNGEYVELIGEMGEWFRNCNLKIKREAFGG